MPVTQIETTPAWESYLDFTQDVKPFLQFPAGTNASDPRLQLLTDTACTAIQNYLGRPIAPTTFFRRFSGWSGLNGSYISLPYYPVLSVTSVVEYWGSSGPHTLAEQTPANQGTQDVYQMDYLRGIVIRTFMGLVQRPWFPGSRNIEITWQAGYQPVPADIRTATIMVIEHWWHRWQQASRTSPIPAGANLDQAPTMGYSAGIPVDAEMLLQPYLQVGIG